jgi:hypothetical protein
MNVEKHIDTDKTLEFHQLVLPKESVESFSARDKKRLLMLTNMMRDMDLFRKLLLYIREQTLCHKELDQAAFITLAFSFIKVLISKVFEIWEFLNSEKIGQEKKSFSKPLSVWWDKIEAFFLYEKNYELFRFVRNKFGFHFDHYQDIEPYIEEAMREVGDLEFWLGIDSSGNDVFAGSNTVMLTVLCNKMSELGFAGNEKELIGHLQRLPIEISHSMNEFCKGYFTEIILKGKRLRQKKVLTVIAPLLSEVNLPLIISSKEGFRER